ncbi:unnamed protein product [Peniophora sp. CBMAI 1063]|nr:unnamed protein product [Peniophora sp. CBMAI 1063]
MSSGDENEHTAVELEHAPAQQPQVKKRRIQTVRACDRCRLKKIRCDGSPTPGSKCSHCMAADAECIFTPGTKQKRQPAQKKYVDALEQRLERMESLLTKLHPNTDFSRELDGDVSAPPNSATWGVQAQRSASASSDTSRFPHVLFDESVDVDTHDEQFVPSPEPLESDEEGTSPGFHELVRKLRELNITGPLTRYYGRSSSLRLVRTALNLKSEVAGSNPDIMHEVMVNAQKRPDFWKLHPWERTRFSQEQKSPFVFPDADLMAKLIAEFFRLSHKLCPVLHRQTFEAHVAEGKHLREEGFGCVVLLVCALGARFVDDPRVFLNHPDKPAHPHSAGWLWFNQVQLVRNVALADPTLHDLQCMALSVIFLAGMSPPQACWTMAGIGIRMAQDVGAHRRKTYSHHSVESELWKRAFWMLVTLDIWFSSFLGRSCAISLDSFDVEFPLDCDDEYWCNSDSEKAFKQPEGKPSDVAFFIAWIKLQLIHSHALRTIYSLEKHKVISKIGEQEWEKRVVSELDSALNRWVDALPDHLRWDPDRTNETHFFQTVALHAAYHLVQMTIHRPFIPSSGKESSISYPSLTICANSARACIHVLEAHSRRIPRVMMMNMLIPGFQASIVLLLRIWLAKRAGIQVDVAKELKDVQVVIDFLAAGEHKWPLSGRFKDMLITLSTVRDWPCQNGPMPSASTKRAHPDTDTEEEPAPQPARQFPPSSGFARSTVPLSARHHPSLSQTIARCTSNLDNVSTFGPPLQNEDATASLFSGTSADAAMGVNDPLAAAGNAYAQYQSLNPQPTNTPNVEWGYIPARKASQPYTANAPAPQVSQQGAEELYKMFGGTLGGIIPGADTPSPSSIQSSPATHLGLSSNMYTDSMFGIDVPPPPTPSYRGPSSFPGVPAPNPDEIQQFFAPMVAHDGHLGVDSDLVSMWSSMPSAYSSEDWDHYVSNMLRIAPSNINGPVPQGAPSQSNQQNMMY